MPAETAGEIAMAEVPAADRDATREDPATTSQHQLNLFEVWKEYEQIAVHFNDLLMRLRIQAISVVTAVAAIAGIVLKESGKIQWDMLSFAFRGLILFWLAVWLLDLMYYTRLLYGAVEAIKELEKQSKKHAENHPGLIYLDLSTTIDKRFGTDTGTWFKPIGPLIFYIIVCILLLLLCWWTTEQANEERGPGKLAAPVVVPVPKATTAKG
jgi:hypothetical protein